MKKYSLFLLCVIITHIGLYAQPEFVNYTTVDGLNANVVYTIAIDKENNKWFGFFIYGSGVSKFDGTNWTTYDTSDGLVDNNVCAIAIDKDGSKWFGTVSQGVSKFDGNKWTTYKAFNGLAGNRINTIVIDKNGVKWFGTNGGVSKFDGNNWKTYSTKDGLERNEVGPIAIEDNGCKWIGYGMGGKGVSKFDGTFAFCSTYTAGHGPINDSVYAIAIDKKGDKWFGFGVHEGLNKYDGIYWNLYWPTYASDVGVITIDHNDIKWLGFRIYGRGVTKFDGNDWINYRVKDGLAGDSVYSIAVDLQNNKWIGTWGGGVSMLVDSFSTGIKYVKDVALNSNNVFTIHTVGQSIFINYRQKVCGNVTLILYDSHGKCIHRVHEYKSIGVYRVNWDLNKCCSGIYYLKLYMGDNHLTQKFVLIN